MATIVNLFGGAGSGNTNTSTSPISVTDARDGSAKTVTIEEVAQNAEDSTLFTVEDDRTTVEYPIDNEIHEINRK